MLSSKEIVAGKELLMIHSGGGRERKEGERGRRGGLS